MKEVRSLGVSSSEGGVALSWKEIYSPDAHFYYVMFGFQSYRVKKVQQRLFNNKGKCKKYRSAIWIQFENTSFMGKCSF